MVCPNQFNVHRDNSESLHSSVTFFISHILAMSNVTCNPFVYFWLNKVNKSFPSFKYINLFKILAFSRLSQELLLLDEECPAVRPGPGAGGSRLH